MIVCQIFIVNVMNPKVSVIIPIYGVEQYIERCARSLFEQTLDDIEFIFVNDCTRDNSINILQQVIENYPNRKNQIKIIHHETNKGLPAARQTGLSIAKGSYIAHCDSDDWVDTDLYECMYKSSVNQGFDVVCCDCRDTDCVNFKLRRSGYKSSHQNYIVDMMHRVMWWSLCNKLIKKDCYVDDIIYPKDSMGEDMCVCLQLMKNAKSVGHIEGSYYYYFKNPVSIANVWTKEQCLSKYDQLMRNIQIVKNYYADVTENLIIKGLDYLEYYALEMLMPAVDDDEIRGIWRKKLSGRLVPAIFNKYAVPKQRLKALLIYLRIYPTSLIFK